MALGLVGLFAPGRLAWSQLQPLFPGEAFASDDEIGASGESDLGGSVAPFVDSDLARSFDVLRSEIEAGRFDVAVGALGRLLERRAGADVFLARRADHETDHSLLAEARRLLAELPAEARQRYETEFGPPARILLSGAIERDDLAALQDVFVRYLHTQAGAEALWRMGLIHRDRGRPRDAALCWDRLQALPLAASFEPQLSLRLAAAWQDCGETERAQRARDRLSEVRTAAVLRIGGGDVPWSETAAAEVLQRFAEPAAAEPAADGDWPFPGGGPVRRRQVAATDPLLLPRWSQPLVTSAAEITTIEQSFQTFVAGGAARLPLPSPVAAGELVLLRSADGVHAFDSATGRPLWTCAVDGPPADPAIRLWTDTTCGSLAVGDGAFYLVEPATADPLLPGSDASLQDIAPPVLRIQNRRLWGFMAPAGPFGAADEMLRSRVAPNLLTSRALTPPRQGNLLWRVGGRSGHAEPRLAGMHFLGTPLPQAGRVFVLGERADLLHLAVLDAATGTLEWLQPLATVPRAIDSDPFRRSVGATTSLADGVVVCPTSGGGVVAVDVVLRSLLWVYRYPRRAESVFAPDEGLMPTLEQRDRWIDPAATIAHGRVLLAPPESEHLHCLDLRTGKRLWRTDRGDGLFVAAVHENQVVIVGSRSLFAVRLDNGKPAWTIRLPLPENSLPTGRGLHAGKHYYLPLSNASLAVFDLDVGWLARLIRSPRQKALGNLIHHRGRFISQGPLFLEAFDEEAALRERAEAALQADPGDAEALTRLGELELAAGRLEGALTAYRRAWAATPSARIRDLYAAALFDAIRALPEREAEFNAELNRLLP